MLSLLVAAALAAVPSARTRGVRGPGPRPGLSHSATCATTWSLRIPGDRARPVEGRVVVRFTLRAPTDVVLDFAQPAERVRAVRVGDRDVPFTARNGHIVRGRRTSPAGENAIAIDFVAGDEALNRSDDFLYTLFVPARAHLAFPCFDQPDLKARYTLTLTVPGARGRWSANGGR